jgi:hypothetical protein
LNGESAWLIDAGGMDERIWFAAPFQERRKIECGFVRLGSATRQLWLKGSGAALAVLLASAARLELRRYR